MKRLRVWSWALAVRQRSQIWWTCWSQTRIERKQKRAQKRLLLLQLETDHQLLLVKELSQRQQQLEHRQQELQESRAYRLTGQLEPPR